MEEQTNAIESLIEKAEEYSKTSIELLKLKAVDKSSEALSSLVPRLLVFISVLLFLLILNIGIALWLGEILGKSYYGFFAIAGLYALAGLFMHFFLRNWIKRKVSNAFIKRMLNL